MSRKEKKQVTKIAIFLTSIFVIFLSVTYAFINITLTGTKKQIINAGILEVELEEENAITIENALPMYDETGMIQDAFVFHVRNNGELRANYILRLEDMTQSAEKLSTADVKYGLKKGNDTTIDFLSSLEDGKIDEGSLGKGESTTYELRLWIRDDLTEEELIAGKSLSYRLAVDVTGLVESDPPVVTVINPTDAETSAVPNYTVNGSISDTSEVKSVTVNGTEVPVTDNSFSQTIPLVSGENKVTVMATDQFGNQTEVTRTIYYWDVNSTSDMQEFASNQTYVESGLKNDTFRSNLWDSITACQQLAASSVAIESIKGNTTCREELSAQVDRAYNEEINTLNYYVGAKTYLYLGGITRVGGGFSSPDGFVRYDDGFGEPYNNGGLTIGNGYMLLAPTAPGYFMSAVTDNPIVLANHHSVSFYINVVTPPLNNGQTWGYAGIYHSKSHIDTDPTIQVPTVWTAGLQTKTANLSGLTTGYVGIVTSIAGANAASPNIVIYSIYLS